MIRLPVREEKKARPAKKRPDTPPMTKGNMQIRVVSFAIVVAVVFAILAARLWYLQILTGTEYSVAAQATQTLEVKDPAQRGVIRDRDGEVLANNVPGLNVTVTPANISREKVGEMAKILGANPETALESYDAAFDWGTQYSPMLVKENAPNDGVTYIMERTEEFPGVVVNDDYIRNYPAGETAAHILGYTGAITQEELELDTFDGLSNDSVVGKTGVELYYEEILRGKAGKQVYNVDALGRIVPDGSRVDSLNRFVDENGDPIAVDPSKELPDHVEDPVPGQDLNLTVDLDLQKVAEDELDAAIKRAQGAGYAGSGGAAVAMDPRNGEILALASRPTFDPQLFVGGISGSQEVETYKYLTSEYASYPFTNRAITGGQPAASTFKPFTGLAGLTFGVMDAYTTYTDTGECWQPTGVTASPCYQSWRQNSPNYEYLGDHGTQNFAEALKDSNDKFFYQVADWIWQATEDKDWLPHFYERFGFGAPTGIDLAGETTGRVPTRAGEKELYAALGKPEEAYWSVGDWVNLSIGQGDLLVSPVQLARAYAAIYNGGTIVTPHVGDEIRHDGKLAREISPEPGAQLDIEDYHFENAIEGMRGVTSNGGTAESVFKGSELSVVGKSGTGETPKGYVNWFIGWAENQEQPMIVVVMIEGGGAFQTGSEMTAGPAVRHILEAFYGVKQSPEDPHPTYTEPIPESPAR